MFQTAQDSGKNMTNEKVDISFELLLKQFMFKSGLCILE